MRKRKTVNKTIIACGIIFLLHVVFQAQIKATNIESKYIQLDGVTFQIDPRFELYNIVGSLIPEWPFSNGFDIRYRKEAQAYFSKYSSHPSVVDFVTNWTNSFNSIDAPVEFLLKCDHTMMPITPFNDSRDTLAKSLHQFMMDSEFESFFLSQSDFYETVLSEIKYNFSDFKERSRIADYYGFELNSYTCILNIQSRGNFGVRISHDNNYDSYICLQPTDVMGSMPAWDNSYRMYNLIWHELSHAYINPLVDKYTDIVDTYSYLFKPIMSSMKSQAYQSWNTTVKEHMVRAVSTRLAAQKYGEDAAYLNHQRNEIGRRFIYINYILEELEGYEKQDSSFISCFPEILNSFSNIDTSDIDSMNQLVNKIREPYVSQIPTLNSFPGSDEIAIVYPTNIPDKETAEKLLKSIEEFKSNFYKNHILIADTAATKENLHDKAIIAFGTKESNLLLKKCNIPLIITPKKVVLNEEVKGNDYQLLYSWINPFNTSKPMKVFSAQEIENLINIRDVLVGEDHYILMLNNQPVKRGKFINDMNIWFCS